MTARTIHLIRHAEVANPQHVVYADLPGFGLSGRGRIQAAAAADRLRADGIDVVVSSPLDRAVETAEAIAAAQGLSVVVDERLTEWRLSSRWAGVAWDDLPFRFPGELEAYLDHPDRLDFTPETIHEVATRMVAAVRDRAHGNRTAVFVSHQDPVQAARLALTGRSLTSLPAGKPGHGAIVSLSGTDPGWREVSVWEPHQL